MDDQINEMDIAIIGMACRFPGAEDVNQFWHNLIQGIESLNQFAIYEPCCQESIGNHPFPFIKVNNLIKDYDAFDAEFFAVSEQEAKLMDPQHRLFLECAWSALEHAGYVPDQLSSLTGLYAGVYANHYLIHHVLPHQRSQDPASEIAITIGNEKDHLTTYTAYKLNLTGPVMTVQTTCSSALASVHLACESLLTYSSDMMLAGGATISIPQIGGYYYQKGGLLAEDGHVRSFDKEATGTVYSNGVGVVVLKRLQDALKERDTIYAVIKGSALNNDGSAKIGYVAPSIKGQSEVIKRALRNAEVHPSTITYVEGHGTGTPLGDGIEIEALHDAFKGVMPNSCWLGSVKSNIGHLGPVSGLAGLIKVAFSLHSGQLPPSLNCSQPHEKLTETLSPFKINSQVEKWVCQGKRRASLSSFGLGGTNVHAILEEPPTNHFSPPLEKEEYLFCLSATNASSLQLMIKQMKNYLNECPKLHPRDIAYTLQIGRKPFSWRYCTPFKTVADLSHRLGEAQIANPHQPLPLFIYFSDEIQINREDAFRIIEANSALKTHFEHLLSLLPTHSNTSERLFSFAFSYACCLYWLDLGLPIAGIIAKGWGGVIGLFLSKRIPLSQLIHIDEKASYLATLQMFESYPTMIPLYHLNEQEHRLSGLLLSPTHPLLQTFHLDSTLECTPISDLQGESFLSLLGWLWSQGFLINWKPFYDKQPAYRIPLPTYAFQKKKYWLHVNPPLYQEEVKSQENGDIVQEMISLWQKQLGLDEIMLEDNFFEKGGNSLVATSLVTAIQQHFNVSIELKDLFDHPTVKGTINLVLDKLLLEIDDTQLSLLTENLHG